MAPIIRPADATALSPADPHSQLLSLAARTIADAHHNRLAARQDTPSDGFTNTLDTIKPVPAWYGDLNSSPSAGAVAGIVLGSFFGFLVLLSFLYICCSFGPAADTTSSWGGHSVTLRRTRSHRSPGRRSRSRRRSKHRVSRVSETVEVRTTGPLPAPRPSMSRGAPVIVNAPEPYSDDDIIVEERRRSRSGRPVAIPVVPAAPRAVHSDDDDENEVVVIEERPPRRSHSNRRNSGGGGYRDSRRYSRG